MQEIDHQINSLKASMMATAAELTNLTVERDGVDGFAATAKFMLAGTMSVLHPLVGQKMAYEMISVLLDQMGTMKLPEQFNHKGVSPS
jgi:hypothetical protein